jgi:aryl-phospho-beta-D-glucosidase BglC (GH1 family)
MKKSIITLLGVLAILLLSPSCEKDSNAANPQIDSTFTVSVDTLALTSFANDTTFKIKIGAGDWKISSDQTWCKVTPETSKDTATQVTVTVTENTTFDSNRIATLTVVKDSTKSATIKVVQSARESFPSYRTWVAPNSNGMGSTAAQLAAKINLGWNIGNTMEAIGSETAWGNPRVSKALIDLVKQSGFNAIRIPCAWDQYMDNGYNAHIRATWLSRVKEVVQYCVDNDMYVLLNIHWDGGWLENNCTTAKQKANNAKQKAFWEQIATTLRDFDEHVLFASANEPNVKNATQMAVLNSYHQTFINAVRSTGGRNSYRVLVVQGPSTDIETTNKLMTSLPKDSIPNRMMVEVHYYTPWNFCGMTKDETWGSMFYYWGSGFHSTADATHNATWGEESTVMSFFNLMKKQFVDKGIPVVMGEYAPTRRSALTGDALQQHLASRAYYLKYVTKQAKANGILPFYWDNGGNDDNSTGIFNRKSNTVFDQQSLDALVQGAAK